MDLGRAALAMGTALAATALLAQGPAPRPAASAPLSPSEIAARAPAGAWQAIAADDLLVMRLAPTSDGVRREVVIQLIARDFAQPWVGNVRTLARARWWDGLSINRVQDNYVVQWGDADGEDAAKAKRLPTGMRPTAQADYTSAVARARLTAPRADSYAPMAGFVDGWPVGFDAGRAWPAHCYAMVGVGRGMAPDAGSGAELYTVVGHAPRHLDRNIAVVGRVISGIEHLSSLPRGTGGLGFYERPERRVRIESIRLASDLPEAERPRFEFLRTDTPQFARYAEARANRRDAFFVRPAGGADVCNVTVPVRRVAQPSR